MFRFRPFFQICFTYSIAGNIRRQRRKGNLPEKAPKADRRGCTCAPALLSYDGRAGERKSHISTPSDMLRFRPFFPVCITHSSAKGCLRQERSMTAQTFRLPLTLFNTFNIFPHTGQCAFPWTVQVMGNSGQSAFPVRFFLLHRIGRPRLSALRRNARLSSKRTGTSPTVTRRRIPPRNIRNHSLYLSGTALCGAINAYERPAAEGLVKLARLCVAPRRDRSAVPDFTSYCNFSAENRVNNKGRIRPAAVLYREGTLRRPAGPYFGENNRATPT